jgi:hypothetical protein
MIRLFVILLILVCPFISQASTYYVDKDSIGGECSDSGGGTALDAPWCTIHKAVTTATAGDTVNVRQGTYSGDAFHPSNSGTGTGTNRLIFQKYPGDNNPVITGNDATAIGYGIYLSGKSYIKIDGFTIKDISGSIWARLMNSTHHIEITNCVFTNDTYTNGGSIVIQGFVSGLDYSGHSTHNWIHGNTLSDSGEAECNEGTNIINIGSNTTGDSGSNNNTIENNTVYHAGHALTEDFGSYNVWRNNILHNEGWKPFSGVYGTAEGGDETHLIDTTKNFTTEGVAVGNKLHATSNQTYSWATATITAIGQTTNPNDTLTYTVANDRTLNFSGGGIGYVISKNSCTQAPDPSGSYPGNAKYGHRAMSVSGDNDTGTKSYILIEGNRTGYASINPNNNGADALTISARGNIVRYNSFFGSDGPGINLKGYSCNISGTCAGSENSIYNNTIWGNGRFIVGGDNPPPPAAGVYRYAIASTGNKIKNNIIYNNYNAYSYDTGFNGIYAGDAKSEQTWAANLCDVTDGDMGCIAGTPTFVSTTMTDPTSTTAPDFRPLNASSPQVNGGTNLTTVHADDTSSGTSLIVTDSLYFQAGSEETCGTTAKTISIGSCLSSVQGDWIKVGATLATSQETQVVDIVTYSSTKGTMTISPAITRSNGDKVWLYKKSDGVQVLYGTAPDIGAHEYDPSTERPSMSVGSGAGVSIGAGATLTVY